MTTAEVLIPHWNRSESLRRTLMSLAEQDRAAAVCVIDNGSTDATPDVLADFPETRVVRLDRNLGFGTAINRGAESSTADVVIFLNNDAVADRGFVAGLLAEKERTGAEMVCGCMRSTDGLIETLGIEIDRSLIVYDYMHGVDFDAVSRDVAPPLAPCGGAAAFERHAFLSLDGFDKAIFAYLEDADLGLRMRRAGMRCAVAPNAFVWHEHSGTLGARSAAKNELLGWARGYMLRKHGRELSARQRLRGLVLDGTVVTGKALIDRDLGVLRGRLRARRELRGMTLAQNGGREAIPFVSMSLPQAMRRRLARRSARVAQRAPSA